MNVNKKYLKEYDYFRQGRPDEIWEKISEICVDLENVLNDLANNILPIVHIQN